ncbi:adenosylmethionine decarboxylase [Halanaerobium kushneri]|jgi:S-adenosylmethionine decarboxylase|uniref:S-adenosylmethionine decarboxylase proenzyme n=1 Tax=Halanaerobium kushneri TaxID=56779 RepID=A0A1N6YTM8_9FIRM|nr:adenosylmethionine decarboxylase [Halanaerobium kushneri]SIR17973.1 S-adenosylmethionine decarboxylase [Halanaerobium kushneri]
MIKTKKEILGKHIVLEISECNNKKLNDVEFVEKIMVKAALTAGLEISDVVFNQFKSQGVTGVVMIAESHLTIHTWPELGYAAVDLFTCSQSFNTFAAVDLIKEKFEAKRTEVEEIKRGTIKENKLSSLIHFC